MKKVTLQCVSAVKRKIPYSVSCIVALFLTGRFRPVLASFAFDSHALHREGSSQGKWAKPNPLLRKRGQMKDKENRTEKVTIRLTPDELSRLRELSYSSYRLMADYCRDCIFGREITVIPGFDEAANQLRRIGTNLNQLTRLANLREISVVDLTETKAEIAKIYDILRAVSKGGR